MGKLRIGPPISVIKASKGTKSSPINFYATSYSSSHGNDNFIPQAVKPDGTGYKANFRPDIYYTTRLDKLDNVNLGKEMEENYVTSYVKKHQPYVTGSNGKSRLPLSVLSKESGFTQQAPITYPDSKKVEISRVNTMTANVYKPLLRRLHTKRVAHLDDGSMTLATETTTCYLGKPSERMPTHMKDVGFMEPSGFTHYHHFDPIQYLDKAPFDGAQDGHLTRRPTGASEHQNNFVLWPNMTGYSHETAKPRFAHRTTHDAFTTLNQLPSAVVSRVKKKDPCEYINLKLAGDHTTLARTCFRGKQSPSKSADHRLSRITVGQKELTGFSTNNGSCVDKPGEQSRFISHYEGKFGPKLATYPGAAAVSGNTKPTNGFTKSTKVHTFGNAIAFRSTNLEVLHPFVAKVTKLDNPCYMDNTRNMKWKKLV